MQSNFGSFLWIGMTCKQFENGKLPVVNQRLSKSASWLEKSFLSSFNTLVGIPYGPLRRESV